MKMTLNRSTWFAGAGALALTLGLGAMAHGNKSRPKVLLFISTDCPIAMGYTPRINALYEKYSAEGVDFEAVFPNDLETKPGITAYMSERSYKFPYEVDLGAKEAKKLRVGTIPSAVIVDSAGNELYNGAIDDNGDPTLARKHYLDDALAAVVDGHQPSTKKTAPFGCVIMPSKAPPLVAKVNYAADIKPILEKHCVQCHEPGEVAPFSLMGYANARKWSPNIVRVTGSRQMPPWKAIHGYGEFDHDNSLSETEIATLARWDEAGAPKGKLGKEDLTVPPKPEWALGKPDMIVSADKPYNVAADGTDVYRNFVIHTTFDHPMYIQGIDVKPGNRKVVHHVIIFSDISKYSDKLVAKCTDGQEGYESSGGGPGFFPDATLGGWVPGSTPRKAPPKLAFLLKPGARYRFAGSLSQGRQTRRGPNQGGALL